MRGPVGATKELLIIDAVLREEKRVAMDRGSTLSTVDVSKVKETVEDTVAKHLMDMDNEEDIVVLESKSKDKGSKKDAKYTGEITFRISGIPAKDAEEALEKFRKYIGNQLRDQSSKVRKQFLKTAKVSEE